MPTANEAYRDRRDDLIAFVRCPECGGDADLEVSTNQRFDDGRNVSIRGVCVEPDCGHETEPLPIAESEEALYQRVRDALDGRRLR